MATHNKTVSITDDDQKLLSNDLYNDMSDNAGLDKWIQDAVDGKINIVGKECNENGLQN